MVVEGDQGLAVFGEIVVGARQSGIGGEVYESAVGAAGAVYGRDCAAGDGRGGGDGEIDRGAEAVAARGVIGHCERSRARNGTSRYGVRTGIGGVPGDGSEPAMKTHDSGTSKSIDAVRSIRTGIYHQDMPSGYRQTRRSFKLDIAGLSNGEGDDAVMGIGHEVAAGSRRSIRHHETGFAQQRDRVLRVQAGIGIIGVVAQTDSAAGGRPRGNGINARGVDGIGACDG